MNSIKHHKGYSVTADNIRLFEQSWLPNNIKAIVIIVHGYAEHSDRYAWVASQLTSQDFAVYSFDLRGHGKSEGNRGTINSFDTYLKDLESFINEIRLREVSQPIFLLGHSLGGAISSLFAIRNKFSISGLILSSALIGFSNKLILKSTSLMVLIARIVPTLPITRLDSHKISRDIKVVNSYKDDPLVYQGYISAQMLAAILKAISEIQANSDKIEIPLLILHGTADEIVTMKASQHLYKNISSKQKNVILYDGLYHEILNEPERNKVIFDIKTWIKNQI